MEDNQSDSIWSQLKKSMFRSKGEEDLPLEKAIAEAKAEDDLDEGDADILLNVLRLTQKTVDDIMVTRTEMICADMEAPLAEVGQLVLDHGHSRIPVYKGDKDNIVGLVYAKDLLTAFLGNAQPPPPISDIMRPVLFVPENKNVRDMLQEFLSRRRHMAIVLDEYGGTSGLLTLEDVIEEIVGDIHDEHDVQEPEEFQFLDNGEVLVSGRAMLADLERVVGISLSSEQVETVGGYVTEVAGRVPAKGEVFDLDGCKAVIREADKKLVYWIAMSAPPAPKPQDETPPPASE